MIDVVGEAPSRVMRRDDPPLLLARHELARMCRVGLEEFLLHFKLHNVLDEWPGKEGKGDRFPLSEARAKASVLWPKLGNQVILLGQRVGRAFDVTTDFFEWTPKDGRMVCVAPHPSHVSRWWNEYSNRQRAREFWRSCVEGTGVAPGRA